MGCTCELPDQVRSKFRAFVCLTGAAVCKTLFSLHKCVRVCVCVCVYTQQRDTMYLTAAGMLSHSARQAYNKDKFSLVLP
jgi:hypothetical protein